MAFFITCPCCGTRDVTEFRYGGQILPSQDAYRYGGLRLPGADGVVPPGGNLIGVHRERWYHRLGCRRWLVAERNVQTNQVFSTAWLDGEAT